MDFINKLKSFNKKNKIFTNPNNKYPGINYFLLLGDENPQIVI